MIVVMKTFLLASLLIATSAQAEVFRCIQPDGTTTFADVPCRVQPATPAIEDTAAASDSSFDSPSDSPLDSQLDSQLKGHHPKNETEQAASATHSADQAQPTIQALETRLEELREDREAEIASAPFSANDPKVLAQLKRQIRAKYQLQIDQTLQHLLQLRREKSANSQDSAPDLAD